MSGERDLAIVLSGGGINAILLEVGFLQALRAEPLWSRVGWIYGTSAGALSGMMAAIDRLDELEEFLLELQPEEVFSPNPLWQTPLGGLRGYALPGTIAERLGQPGAFGLALAASPIELTVIATDVSVTEEATDTDRHYELVYSSRVTPPDTMIRAVLASAAVSALVLPVRIDEGTIATDGGWVRNFPLGHARANPSVRAIAALRYVASYGPTDPAGLARFRDRLSRFRAAPPVRALITELAAAERRSERGEPAHLGEMIVRLMRIAIARNTVLEERLAEERDLVATELAGLRAETIDVALAAAAPWRRRRLREALEGRFEATRVALGDHRDISRLVIRADAGEHALDPGFRGLWSEEAKRGLLARGRALAREALADWPPGPGVGSETAT